MVVVVVVVEVVMVKVVKEVVKNTKTQGVAIQSRTYVSDESIRKVVKFVW